MNKKKAICLGIVLIIIIAIIAIFYIKANNKKNVAINTKIAETINKNSKLPIEYMSKYEDEKTDNKLQNYEKLDNYMSKDFKSDDILFSYYGYPNDRSDFLLGEIKLLTNKYNILGVTIGDNMEKAIKKLEGFGFKLEDRNNYFMARLNYNDLTIELEADSQDYTEEQNEVVIGQMLLRLQSDYTGDVLY